MKEYKSILTVLLISQFVVSCVELGSEREHCNGYPFVFNPIQNISVNQSIEEYRIDLAGSDSSLFAHTENKSITFVSNSQLNETINRNDGNMGWYYLVQLDTTGNFHIEIIAEDGCEKTEAFNFQIQILAE
jgi:hypothetical protein